MPLNTCLAPLLKGSQQLLLLNPERPAKAPRCGGFCALQSKAARGVDVLVIPFVSSCMVA